jgi:membrane-associated protease RseP (regulator of RpoE activity)
MLRGRFNPLIVVLLSLLARAHAQSQPRLPLSIPFNFENNQIYLRVAINHSEPRWFVLDSGASGCVIDTGVARRLGIATEGERQGTGAGKGTVKITFAKDVNYSLGGVSFTLPQSYVIDLSGQPAMIGRELAGIIGGDFFLQFVVEVDYEAQVITLYDPAAFKSAASATAIPVTINKKTPYIKIGITVAGRERVERVVQIDSGSGDAVDEDALAQSPQKLEIVGGTGLGQEFRTVLARAQKVEIGPLVLEQPTGAPGGVALIGTEVLRRFLVVFDYNHSQVFLTPNAHFRDPFVVDASGLNLRWSPELTTFVAHDVASASPASEAGLKTGDKIVAINGQAADRFRIEQLQTMLTQAGKEYELTVMRGSELLSVKIKLRKRL